MRSRAKLLEPFLPSGESGAGKPIPERSEKILAVLAAFCAINIAAVWASAWVAGRLFGLR